MTPSQIIEAEVAAAEVPMSDALARALEAVEDMEQDVKLYRWLRAQHWSDNVIAVVLRPKDAVKLGYDCPSGVRLDEVIIAAMENSDG